MIYSVGEAIMENVHRCLMKHIEQKHLTGAAFAISVNGNTVCRDDLGYADCEQKRPLCNRAVFRLASMTKPVTSVAAMICKERGLLDFDAPIGKYIEGFSHCGVGKIENGEVVFAKAARAITLRDIFTHSSGLGSGIIGDLQYKSMKPFNTLSESAKAWNRCFLDFEPRSKAAYSAVTAFELAALAVERVSQKPYERFLQDEIFSKLDMADTCYSLTAEQASRLVEMPLPDNNGHILKKDFGLKGFNLFTEGYTGGSAGLFSTLDDYLAFAEMLALGGKRNGVRILSESSVREMGTPIFQSWGVGVYVRGPQIKVQPLPQGSFGWSGAYGTHFWVEPKSKTAAVLMLNHADCGGSASPFSAEFERLSKKDIKSALLKIGCKND